jgi:ribonuclease HII
MKNKTWKGVSAEQSETVKEVLRSHGGEADQEVKGQDEAWRIRVENAVFTFYKKGTLYFSGGDGTAIEASVAEVSRILTVIGFETEKEFLVGMDETGKGEVLGPSVLAVVVLAKELGPKVDAELGAADTKKKHSFQSWDTLFRDLDRFRGHGLSYEIETIPPWDVDKYNVNKLMDIVYQRLLSRLLCGLDPTKCRIVLDDYGIGNNLHLYMKALSKAGAEVRVEARADEKYVEVKTASVLSKWRRELAMKKIGEKFSIPGALLGSGNAGDPLTVKWLKEWKKSGQQWPWFVKLSWKTIRELDGIEKESAKGSPPVRHDILSRDSQNMFRNGRLSTSSVRVICPDCGVSLSSCKLTPEPAGGLVGRCIQCNATIPDLGITLRYYCGSALLDSSTIISGSVSKDLQKRGFFAGYTLLLHPLVAIETDNPGGKKELELLGDYAAMDRVALRRVDDSNDKSENHDQVIIQAAKQQDAILVTRDRGMYGNAVAQGVFCLTFRLEPMATKENDQEH